MKILTIVAAVAFAFGMSSCKKCIECKAEGGSSNLSQVKQEYCGSKAERDDYSASFRLTYNALGYQSVSCD